MKKPNRQAQDRRRDLAEACKVEMPWERGARRKQMIARRKLGWPPKVETSYEPKSA